LFYFSHGVIELTSLRSHILTTFLSALTTIPSPVIRLPPSIHSTFFRGNPYPWSFSANGRAERMSYNNVCPLDVPIAYDNPSAREEMAVTESPAPGPCSVPGTVDICTGAVVVGSSLFFGSRNMPTLVRERGSQNRTEPFPSTPNARSWCAGFTSMVFTPGISPPSSLSCRTRGLRKRP
jgi:hypothetical protein